MDNGIPSSTPLSSIPIGDGLSRREFARLCMGGAVAVPFVQPNRAVAESDSGDDAPQADPKKDDSATEDQPKEPERRPPAPAELLTNVILQLYPDERLTEEVVENIWWDMDRFLRRSNILSSYPLKNSDEPAFVFSAFRAEE